MLQNFDRDALRKSYSSAVPFPFVHIDNFVNPDFAEELATDVRRSLDEGVRHSIN
jgi:hypothetical protein